MGDEGDFMEDPFVDLLTSIAAELRAFGSRCERSGTTKQTDPGLRLHDGSVLLTRLDGAIVLRRTI